MAQKDPSLRLDAGPPLEAGVSSSTDLLQRSAKSRLSRRPNSVVYRPSTKMLANGMQQATPCRACRL